MHRSEAPEGLGAGGGRQTARSKGRPQRSRQRRRRPRPRQTEPVRPSLQVLTQNVRGFAKVAERRQEWFDGLRQHRNGQQLDAVLLQETRAHGDWAERLESEYALKWGIRPAVTPRLSFWSSPPTAAGGVAILLRSDSALTDAKPLWEEHWSTHFLAITAQWYGQQVTLVCIYGSVCRLERESLFHLLSRLEKPTGLVLLGGDFNCTLDAELDRSVSRRKNYDSPALVDWIHAWNLADTATGSMLDADSPASVEEFHRTYHTFSHRQADGTRSTCRLDRWYVTKPHFAQLGHTLVMEPPCRSDHQAVLLTLYRPGEARHQPKRCRGRKGIRYPLHRDESATVQELYLQHLQDLVPKMLAMTPTESAKAWDVGKDTIRRECLVALRKQAHARRAAAKQRTRRLRAAIANEQRHHQVHSSPSDPVEHVTEDLDRLSLEPRSRYHLLRHQLIDTHRRHAKRQRRRKFGQYRGQSPAAVRAFFKRISVKFGRRQHVSPPPIPSNARCAADAMANDWRPIIQRQPKDADKQDAYFGSLPKRPPMIGPTMFDAPFTQNEVAAALKACHRRKASGPDGLPNDLYRDVEDELPELLAPLFWQWPIALLNSDYKIFARLLLNRVRTFLPDLVAPSQCGFVPGRNVHDPVDVWFATRKLVKEGKLPKMVIAILLDIAKAYDTLDHRFLAKSLGWHGLPAHFIEVVVVMHLGTIATYLAAGEISKALDVLNGIRQGCPLAPVLFILAIELLYEMLKQNPRLPGVRLSANVTNKANGCSSLAWVR